MNNPEHRNVLSSKMVDDMLQALEALEKGKAQSSQHQDNQGADPAADERPPVKSTYV
jgi:hypothetical protein